jgi:hypothetical protein
VFGQEISQSPGCGIYKRELLIAEESKEVPNQRDRSAKDKYGTVYFVRFLREAEIVPYFANIMYVKDCLSAVPRAAPKQSDFYYK